MDWASVAGATASGLLGGGLVGGLVALKVSRRESDDRKDVLALEREKWEHERDKPVRGAQRECLSQALTAVREARQYIYACNVDAALLDAMDGNFHKVRVVLGALSRAATDLLHHGLSEESEYVFNLLDNLADSWSDFGAHYSQLFDDCVVTSDALEARLANTYE